MSLIKSIKPWLRIVLLLMVASLLISGCKIRDANAGPDRLVKACKDTSERFRRVYGNQKLPEHLRSDTPVRFSSDFNLQDFLHGFEYIDVNERFKINYVYMYRNSYGRPLLYTVTKGTEEYKTEKEFSDGEPLPFTYGIETDGSDKGFLQLAMAQVLAPNFYLYFRSNEQDMIVLCDIDDIEVLLDELDQRDDVVNKPDLLVKARALTIDAIDPVVRFDKKNNQAVVSMLTFTKWGGFYRQTLTYGVGFPHRSVSITAKQVIAYDAGIK